jgi:predicted acetyltransferase
VKLRPAEPADGPAIAALAREAFQRGPARAPFDDSTFDVTDRFVLVDNDVIVGTAAATPVGQYVAGGAAVPTAAVWSVAVSDTARGRGVGRTVMTELLAWLRHNGIVQSVLFPSVPAPYRGVGYEIAGERRILKTPLHTLPSVPDALPVRAWDDSDLDAVAECYEAFAATQSGLLQRPRTWWTSRVVSGHGGAIVYRRAVEEAGRITGYLVYTKDEAPADLPYYYDVTVHDVAWLTPDAGRSLLDYLGSHRALGVDMRWPAASADAWSAQLAGAAPRVDFAYPWMLRLIDPVAALKARRFPAGLTATVRIAVSDPVLEPEEQVLEVEVSGGAASVSMVEREAAPRLDVGALAAVHSGWSTAADLARAGRLTGATETDVRRLDAVFTGLRPWLPDLF